MQKHAIPDPRFKAVKQHKKNWNKAMKELISRMIAFKRALNGTGDAKYALPASKLQQPIPQELTNFISTLSANYEAVAADALKIMTEQNEFAKNRVVAPPKTAALKSEASNFLSRFWAYVKSPFLSEENKRTRISLLRDLNTFDNLLKDFENEVLSTSSAAIDRAAALFTKVNSKYEAIFSTFDSLVSLQNNGISSTENINTGDLEKLMGSLKNVIADMQWADKVPNIESPQFYSIFNDMVTKYNKESSVAEKKKAAIHIIETYNKALRGANIISKVRAKSFKELFDLLEKNKAQEEINILASNLVTRWLKKKMLNPLNEAVSIRVTIQEASESTRDIVDQLMNSLEHELNIDETRTALYQCYSNLELISKNLVNLSRYKKDKKPTHEKSPPKNHK